MLSVNQHQSVLLLGTNDGNRRELLERALCLIEEKVGAILRQSSIYETECWGREELPQHLNVGILLSTHLAPIDLLNEIQAIENELGRERKEKWGVRTMDIDIIYYDACIINQERLIVPHPLMQERNFVLAPLVEIIPDWSHPVLLKTTAELLAASQDVLQVKPYLL